MGFKFFLMKFKIKKFNKRKNAIHLAVEKNNYQIVQLLLQQKGIDVDAEDEIIIYF